MGQGSVLKILEENKDWLSVKEISSQTGVGEGSTSVSLKKLFNQGEIMRKILRNPRRYFIYKIS